MIIDYNPETRRVTFTKNNGCTFQIAPYNNKDDHRRGAFVVGDTGFTGVAKRTMGKILKKFYPDCTLRYLENYGYISW